MRNNKYLQNKLELYLKSNFQDIKLENRLFIKFGKRAKRQLGSIRQKDGKTLITITGLFKDPQIPDFVVESTLVHELVHYAHGFCSPLKQQYQYPHKHGIMRQEFEKRGLQDLHTSSKKWIKENWEEYLKKQGLNHVKRHKRRYRRKSMLERFLNLEF